MTLITHRLRRIRYIYSGTEPVTARYHQVSMVVRFGSYWTYTGSHRRASIRPRSTLRFRRRLSALAVYGGLYEGSRKLAASSSTNLFNKVN